MASIVNSNWLLYNYIYIVLVVAPFSTSISCSCSPLNPVSNTAAIGPSHVACRAVMFCAVLYFGPFIRSLPTTTSYPLLHCLLHCFMVLLLRINYIKAPGGVGWGLVPQDHFSMHAPIFLCMWYLGLASPVAASAASAIRWIFYVSS